MFVKPNITLMSRYFVLVTKVTSKLHSFLNISKPNVKTFSLTAQCCKLQTYVNKNIVGDDCKKSKLKIISLLNFKSDEDALPFYRLPIKKLLEIYKNTKIDLEFGNCQNRLYYLAERLKCEPSHLSKLIAKRTFIYTTSFDWLKASLDTLLDMGVTEDRILRDLWVLKYNSKTIEERLLKVKSMGVDNVYPWMVRCSEKILARSITISQETKSVLGDVKSTKNYLAKRLNIPTEAMEDIYFTVPALKQIRASKVKKFLDFLIEEGFKIEDIATKPRVISASQTTVKMRLDKLRKLGLTEINLNVLCRSRKDFQKYCETFEPSLNVKQS